MLTVEEALERVLAAFDTLDAERVPLLEALGRVLAEDIRAEQDIPPFANSAMDGYAVRAADTAGAHSNAPIRLRVIGEVAAGVIAQAVLGPGSALRIMTGAPLPAGADAVVPVEQTTRAGTEVEIRTPAAPGQHVRPAGEDVRAGVRVLRRGSALGPPEIGMLAALGRAQVRVTRRPRVALVATGDELVALDAIPVPGQIRDANSYSNAAQVLAAGATPLLLGIARDRSEELTHKIRAGIAQGADVFLTSGGVSVGDFDIVKQVMATEGEIGFWRVRMKPGKPLAFGRIGGVPVLGLPGNPVSAMVAFEVFVRPALLKMLGAATLHRPTVEAVLADEVAAKDDRRHYLRVRLEFGENGYCAHLTGAQGSGVLSSMLGADGLAIIPEDWPSAPRGARVRVMRIK